MGADEVAEEVQGAAGRCRVPVRPAPNSVRARAPPANWDDAHPTPPSSLGLLNANHGGDGRYSGPQTVGQGGTLSAEPFFPTSLSDVQHGEHVFGATAVTMMTCRAGRCRRGRRRRRTSACAALRSPTLTPAPAFPKLSHRLAPTSDPSAPENRCCSFSHAVCRHKARMNDKL
jgi:hypothetical protein